MSTNVTITLQSPYPDGDLATRSVDHRRSFEWQKPLLGLGLSLCYGLLGVVAIFSHRLFKKLSFAAHWLPILENR